MKLYFCLPAIDASQGGELCFISHARQNRRIQCNVFGHLTMDTNWQGWEVWRFSRDEQLPGVYIITSWTHDHKVLCSNPDGGVYTTENKEGSWEKWRVSKHPKSKELVIQSVSHGRYLSFSGQDLYTTQKIDSANCSDAARWCLEPAHGNNFFVSATCHNKRLSSNSNQAFTNENWKEWEQWVIEPIAGRAVGSFSIKSRQHEKFLGSSPEGGVFVTDRIQEWEEWRLVANGEKGIFIESVYHEGKRLACNDEGLLYTSNDRGGWETWRLQPLMPHTISGKQIWSLVGLGLGTIGLAIATPFAVMGIIGALGFGVEGIAAGSIAAGMMSAEAIASGGGVVAGGTVATLQSIGAAGLGLAGTSAAVGAGAGAGLAVGGGSLAASGALHHDAATEVVDLYHFLPLCSWRQW